MARVTISDCTKHIPNQFTMIEAASKRARQLAAGQQPLVDADNDKVTVIALREIAAGLIDVSILEEDTEESLVDEVFENKEGSDDNAAESTEVESIEAEATELKPVETEAPTPNNESTETPATEPTASDDGETAEK